MDAPNIPGTQLNALASSLTIGPLFRQQAIYNAARIAIEQAGRKFTYAQLNDRVNRLAHVLASRNLIRGDCVAILSENRHEYVEVQLAAAKIGVALACQNWRQSESELKHCLALGAPRLMLVSERYVDTLMKIRHLDCGVICFGMEYEALLGKASSAEPPDAAEPEDIAVILYTSGTTGFPKAALVSQRAMLARSMISLADGSLFPDRSFVCWSPLFHMAAADNVFGVLTTGGKLIIMDGFNAADLIALIGRERIGVLTLMPGMLDAVERELVRTGTRPKSIEVFGSLADLVPRHRLAAMTTLLNAPFRNTFGSTETGLAPASKGRIPIGVVPERLSKVQSSFCRIRLVDEDDREVPDGEPGEVAMRGPSLFSGYWGDSEATAQAFRNGWYHMGDVLRRNSDGTLDFVDRRKYLIKSGGENIYPAEIERLLLACPRIADAVVVRKPDSRWGEIPVAFIVRADPILTADDVITLCRDQIAGYKIPKEVRFVTESDLPRNLTGKILRHRTRTKHAERNIVEVTDWSL